MPQKCPIIQLFAQDMAGKVTLWHRTLDNSVYHYRMKSKKKSQAQLLTVFHWVLEWI